MHWMALVEIVATRMDQAHIYMPLALSYSDFMKIMQTLTCGSEEGTVVHCALKCQEMQNNTDRIWNCFFNITSLSTSLHLESLPWWYEMIKISSETAQWKQSVAPNSLSSCLAVEKLIYTTEGQLHALLGKQVTEPTLYILMKKCGLCMTGWRSYELYTWWFFCCCLFFPLIFFVYLYFCIFCVIYCGKYENL